MTEPSAAWPLRYRLHRGRLTHLAVVVKGDEADYTRTACDRMIEPRDQQLAADTPFTWQDCRDCAQRLRHPRIGDPRQHTAPVESVNAAGDKVTTVRLQRCCNGCGDELGDADNRDVDRRGNLTDVRAECSTCSTRPEESAR